MSYNYDAQLIDSVRLGQTRVEGALLFGEDRLKRRYQRRTGTFIVSLSLAALIAAGCVIGGWVMEKLREWQASRVTYQQPAVTSPPEAGPPANPGPGVEGWSPPQGSAATTLAPAPADGLTNPGMLPPLEENA
nr:hypothetical protein [Actinomycetales bacterium]